MPGSRLTFTKAQVESDVRPVDWYPDSHPVPPDVVTLGGAGRPTPCAECHLHNGAGFPGAPDLAGLPAGYIVEQLHAFRDGTRRSADAAQPDTAEMVKVARQLTDGQADAAAAYFARLPREAWVRVVEGGTVPRTIPDRYGWRDPDPRGGTESIGDRIIELSNDLSRAVLHDDRVGITDYAPPGAIARGRAVVARGGDARQPCSSCHGAELRGEGAAPPLAGRPAAYLARQIWNIRVGARTGGSVHAMQATANGLTPSQIVDVTAYLASRAP